ncbi:hypothetical protein H0H87_002372 [Tephrocybe sp. NHM501043]|nr:hypothetical protein H0H87_002372 [Tephrocybe sp. NHM501043]
MTLLKIPFLAATLAGTHITYTSPADPPKRDERIEEKTEIKPSRFVPFSKGLFWAFALVELVSIVALTPFSPGLGVYEFPLCLLVPKGRSVRLFITPLSMFGALLSGLGGFIRWDCYRRMGRQFTFDLSIRDGHKLITEGAYKFVRHPGYTSALMTIIGTMCYHGSRGSWLRESGFLDIEAARYFVSFLATMLLSPMFILFDRMRREDKELKEKFETEWDQWAREVPYWLVPGLY